MEIKIEEDKNMNHHQIKLVIHPQTRHIAEKMIDTLNDSLKNIKVYDDENNMYFIPVISIIYIEIIEHHLFAYTKDRIYGLHYYSLKDFIHKQKLHHFCQINAQTIVNIDYIVSYSIDEDSRRKIVLENNEKLIVNRSYKDQFESAMKRKKKVVKSMSLS